MPSLPTDLFDYALPERLIAQTPNAQRDQSRLLVVDRACRSLSHRHFRDLPEFLAPGDILFRNNAAVIPARLHAVRASGGKVECLLLRPHDSEDHWHCLIKPGKKLPIGAQFADEAQTFTGQVVAKNDTDGSALIRFTTRSGETIKEVAQRIGGVPLPPYIQRTLQDSRDHDLERYQTVYANTHQRVAVAAPTAGLHFTPELLSRLNEQGVRSIDVTLHVGLGTFKPILSPSLETHVMHRERYELSVEAQRALFPPLAGRRVAVGTTSVRSIEDFLGHHAAPLNRTHTADTEIFIYPPHRFRGVDALITNFHQPRSTLLCLVAAFLTPGSTDGIAWLQEIYRTAIGENYRFFSYGDAMLIL